MTVALDTATHYARLAKNYDQYWDNPRFTTAWVEQILRLAAPPPAPLIADIGAGTGIIAMELLRQLRYQASILLVDPSVEMLSHAPVHQQLYPVCTSAELFPAQMAWLDVGQVDLMLIQRAVHHFSDVGATLHGLSRTLSPHGSLLVIAQTQPEYPLFPAAFERFTEHLGDPGEIAAHLEAAGLVTSRRPCGFTVEMPRKQWLTMVTNRFLSVLSTFSDDEIARGVHEMATQLGDVDTICFQDNYEFIVGRNGCPC
jgi:ubiquinone/menaquinone biosynthesis C-methylase UbiE